MPKLESKVQDILTGKVKINNLPDDEKWCIYFKYRHQKQTAELIEKLYSKEEGIMLAERAVTGVSRDYKRFARWMAITKNRIEREQNIYNAKKEGRQENALEIAHKMKNAGRPLSEIQEFTGLSIEAIEQL